MKTSTFQPAMASLFRVLLASVLLLLLAACAGGAGSRDQIRDQSLYFYAGAIRWGQMDDALAFVDPEYLQKHPFTELDRSRFEQIRITGYEVKGFEPLGKDEVAQVVEIRLVNERTQVERNFFDRQRWRYDETKKRWLLLTGLPDITSGAR